MVDSPMPGWFTPVVVVLAIAALIFLVGFWRTRQRKHLIGLGVSLALIGVVWLIASLIPTDRRAIEKTLMDIIDGIQKRNTEQVFANVAEDFRYRTYNKSAFRAAADPHIRAGDAADVQVWDFEPDSISRAEKQAEVHFNVRASGVTPSGREFFLCKAKFVLEKDDKWRLQSFELFNPFVETNRPLDIPGLN
jgi:hypothetical protein